MATKAHRPKLPVLTAMSKKMIIIIEPQPSTDQKR